MNRSAQALGRKGKGKPKRMSAAALAQRAAASRAAMLKRSKKVISPLPAHFYDKDKSPVIAAMVVKVLKANRNGLKPQ